MRTLEEKFPKPKHMLDSIRRALDFSTQDIAQQMGYDLASDPLGIGFALQANQQRYQEWLSVQFKSLPPALQQEKADFFHQNLLCKHQESTPRAFEQLLQTLKKYNPHFEGAFYEQALAKIKPDSQADLKSLHQNLCNAWEEILEQKRLEWQQKIVDQARQEMLTRLKEWLEALKKFQAILTQMGAGGALFSDWVLQSLKEGMASGQRFSAWALEDCQPGGG